MKFYTNVFQRGNNVYVRGYENGKRIFKIEQYKPYLFVKDKNGSYKTIHGQYVDKVNFDSIKDAREFFDTYKDVENFEIYGLNNYPYVYIYDNYPGEIKYDPELISVVSLDIEVAADEGFPDIEKADKEITAITISKNNKSYVFGCGDFVSPNEDITYFKCKDEKFLLDIFLKVWNSKEIDPDIITGWNIEFFDIPYIINRIKNVLDESDIKRLSPWKIIEAKTVEFKGKEIQTYSITGISTLDYYQLYRKFSFSNQESYKLDYIAWIVLDEKKVDYSEYGSLLDLYKNNFQKFIEYNIQDTVLVNKLEKKLGFIGQIFAFAYDAKVNYIDTLTTVKPWDVIIHNHLMDRKIVIPQYHKKHMPYPLAGGYVKEPKIGMSKWVVSFDLDSLYPHLIMQYNISPDVYEGRLEDFYTIDELLKENIKFSREQTTADVAVAANGTMYSKKKQGFLATLMESMYNDRIKYKKLMIEAKKKYEETKDPKYDTLALQYHNMQYAKKIQLNSAYGAIANEYFRWFDFNLAEAITVSGQLTIRWVDKRFNEFMNNVLKTKNIDYIIASDTDSVYVNMEPMVNMLNTTDEMIIVKAIDEFAEKKIQPYLKKCFDELFERQNAYKQAMRMKRETIANKSIWKAPKMYILNAWNIEGVQYKEPKLKMKGIEAVRSSTPHACREAIKEALSIIMNKEEKDLKEYVNKFKEKFMTLSFDDVAFPRGVKGLEVYRDKNTIYRKGTPIQVKGSLLFNDMLKRRNIKTIPPIMDGDKIKYVYLKIPNPVHDTVISCPDGLPKEFKLDSYIDRELQFEKGFLGPLKSITEVIGWDPETRATLEDFFS